MGASKISSYNKALNNGISVMGTALGGVVNLLGEQLM